MPVPHADLPYDALPPAIREAVDALNVAIAHVADDDTLDFDLLSLVVGARTAIAEAWEVCPIHECDDSICADDDDPACAHLR